MTQALMPGGGGSVPTKPASRTDHDAEHRRLRQHHRARDSHRRIPCGSNIPNPPIVYLFSIPDTDNDTTNNKWSLVVKWYAVTAAQNGDDVDVDHYVVRVIGYKPDGTTEVYRKSFVVKGEDAAGNDPALEFRHDAVLKRNRRYVAQVRAHTTQKCPGSWSTATSQITVGGTTKPNQITVAPVNTTPDDRRVDFDWNDATDPEFDRYKVEVYYGGTGASPSWSGTPTKTAYTRQSFYRYAVPTGERGGWFRARVYVQSIPDDNGNRTDSVASSYSSGVKASEPSAATPAPGSITAAMLATGAAIGNITDGSINSAKLNGVGLSKLNQGSATTGQALTWDGSSWAPATVTATNATYALALRRTLSQPVTNTWTQDFFYGIRNGQTSTATKYYYLRLTNESNYSRYVATTT